MILLNVIKNIKKYKKKGRVSIMKKAAKKAIIEAINEEKLNGRIIDNIDVLESLPNMFSCLRINGNYVAKCLKETSIEEDKNFFENLLNKFGFEVIKYSKIQSRLEATEREPLIMDNLIVVDDKQLRKSIDEISEILYKKEEETKNNSRSSANKNNSYVRRIDELEQQNAKLMTEYEYMSNSIITGLQDIYVENIRNNLSNDSINEILNNIGIEIVTDIENLKVNKQEAFTVLRVPSLENKINKPCFLKNDKVILKGILYEKVKEQLNRGVAENEKNIRWI